MAVEWKKIAFADHNHTDADLNTVIGPNALVNPTPSTGRTNVAIGVKALNADLTGRGNVVVGPYCADSLTAGNDNVVIGFYAAHDGALSNDNVLVGSNAGRKAEGNSNVAVGYGALYNNTSNKNLAVGRDAGYKNVTGTRNVFVGPSAGYYETGSDKLFIDNLTRTDEATARAKAMIYGVFHADPAYQYLTINAKVTISQNLKVGSDATITEFDTGALADSDTVVPTSKAVLTQFGLYLPLTGGTMSGNIVMGDGVAIGQSAGPLLTFDDTNNYLEITGCKVGIGIAVPVASLHISNNLNTDAYAAYIKREVTDQTSSNIGMNVVVYDNATAEHSNASYGMIFGAYVGDDSYDRGGALYGVQGFAWHTGTGTLSSGRGGYFGSRLTKAGGTITGAYDLSVSGGIASGIAATIGTHYGIRIDNINDSGTINTSYGLYIANRLGTTNYAIYTGTGMVRLGGEFGCNGATPRGKATVNAACSDLTTAVALLNQIRTALVNNGICV